MKRVALINDLSGVGRCSLTVALPVVSAFGHECAVLPTAVLSNHTGFDDYTFFDFTRYMRDYIESWKKLGISFDTVYSGFLGSGLQADITLEFMAYFCKNAVKLVDPVLGDNGELYDTCGGDMISHMRALVRASDVITPNLTELCALAGADYPSDGIAIEKVCSMCGRIDTQSIVVTGLEHDIIPDIGEGKIANLVYENGKADITENKKLPASYCGTGDVFASVLCGGITGGAGLLKAVRSAADFVERCVRDTYNNHGDRLYGVQFEDKLNLLKECF